MRAGQSGGGKSVLTAELAAAIDAKWAQVIGAATGLPSYAAMRAQWRAEQQQS